MAKKFFLNIFITILAASGIIMDRNLKSGIKIEAPIILELKKVKNEL